MAALPPHHCWRRDLQGSSLAPGWQCIYHIIKEASSGNGYSAGVQGSPSVAKVFLQLQASQVFVLNRFHQVVQGACSSLSPLTGEKDCRESKVDSRQASPARLCQGCNVSQGAVRTSLPCESKLPESHVQCTNKHATHLVAVPIKTFLPMPAGVVLKNCQLMSSARAPLACCPGWLASCTCNSHRQQATPTPHSEIHHFIPCYLGGMRACMHACMGVSCER